MSEKLIEIKNLKKHFKTPGGTVHAVDDISFDIARGETVGIVGESGCGKTTTGRVMIRLIEPTAGQVFFEGKDIFSMGKRELNKARKDMQIIFQDPFSSLNPRMTVFEAIALPLNYHKIIPGARQVDIEKRVLSLMETVGLAERLINTYPHELDGGRRQRVGVARAIALNPDFIVCDEPVSALDVSIQSQILNLLGDLQKEMGLAYLFISHDLSVVRYLSDRVCVMFLGKVCEMGLTRSIYGNPLHPYTKFLLEAVPKPDPTRRKEKEVLLGEIPSPINPPSGCRFHTRCPFAKDLCSKEEPQMREVSGHFAAKFPAQAVACHLV